MERQSRGKRRMENSEYLLAVQRAPLVELLSDTRVLVENHKGITCYGPEQISVRLKYGFLHIYGENLEIACMSSCQLVITGRILRLEPERREAVC
jgi:sporulation protein YqfC